MESQTKISFYGQLAGVSTRITEQRINGFAINPIILRYKKARIKFWLLQSQLKEAYKEAVTIVFISVI